MPMIKKTGTFGVLTVEIVFQQANKLFVRTEKRNSICNFITDN